jgi:hypothetical protein
MLPMSTKTMQKSRKATSLRGKKLKPVPFKKQGKFKSTIRSNLEHRRRSEILLTRMKKHEEAA